MGNLCKHTDRNPLPNTQSLLPMKSTNQWQIKDVTRRGQINCLCQVPIHGSRDSNKCPLVSTVVHIVIACTKVLDVASRREFLKCQRLCFNCTRLGLAATQCRSRGCGKWNSRHHKSICVRLNTTLPGNTAST